MKITLHKIKHPFIKLISLLGVALLTCLMARFGIYCVWQKLFHIQCPGCGLTRACLSAFRLNIRSAFRYNYMFWSIPILLIYILFDGRVFSKKAVDAVILSAIGAGFAMLFILRQFGILTV